MSLPLFGVKFPVEDWMGPKYTKLVEVPAAKRTGPVPPVLPAAANWPTMGPGLDVLLTPAIFAVSMDNPVGIPTLAKLAAGVTVVKLISILIESPNLFHVACCADKLPNPALGVTVYTVNMDGIFLSITCQTFDPKEVIKISSP